MKKEINENVFENFADRFFLDSFDYNSTNLSSSTTKATLDEAKIFDLRVNGFIAPVGIDTPSPTFSWKMDSEVIGAVQTAYNVVVTENDGGEVWNSGWVESGISVAIKYDGAALKDQTKYTVSASIKDNNGKICEYITTTFVTAFFNQNAADRHDQRRGKGHGDGDQPGQALAHIGKQHAHEGGNHAQEQGCHEDIPPLAVLVFQVYHTALNLLH